MMPRMAVMRNLVVAWTVAILEQQHGNLAMGVIVILE